MTYKYKTRGTCSSSITVELENGLIKNVSFEGGCSGNTQGIETLVRGMDASKAASMLRGIRCGDKPTSCPDQLSIALDRALAQAGENKSSGSRAAHAKGER